LHDPQIRRVDFLVPNTTDATQPCRMGDARAASHTELAKTIRTIPTYSVYDKIARILRASQEPGQEGKTNLNLHHRGTPRLDCQPVDRAEWFMTPQTVNAYYNSGMNEIVFPAAILQPPFFDMEADDAVNYGGIDAVIGHEIGHGFDDQGSKSDGNGNMVSWWTDADRKQFESRTKMLIEQYSGFEPAQLPGQKVNGALTIGENIGDLGGLSIAYKAYKRSLKGSDAPVIDGLTGDQRFFMGWAQVWRSKYRDAELARRLATDPHSPAEFRCNGVLRNLPEFYAAFGVKEGDKLWLPTDRRVRIW
jgi:putative endopeptidase